MVKKGPVVVPMQVDETYAKMPHVSAPLKAAQKEQGESKPKKNEGIKSYYKYKVETLQLIIQERMQNLRSTPSGSSKKRAKRQSAYAKRRNYAITGTRFLCR